MAAGGGEVTCYILRCRRPGTESMEFRGEDPEIIGGFVVMTFVQGSRSRMCKASEVLSLAIDREVAE